MPSSSLKEMAAKRGDARFPLSRNTQDTRAFARCVIGFGAGAALTCLLLLAVGVLDRGQAASGAVTALIICAGLPLFFGSIRRVASGEVRVNNDGVTLAFRLNASEFPWRDIAAARIATTPPTGFYGLMIKATKAADKHGVIELDLRRPYRIGLRSGTESEGVSTGLRKIRLQIDDPEGFMAVARAHMAA